MAKTRGDSAPEAPSFVFMGTVRKLKAATLPGLPVDERTAIVHVDQVIEAAPAFMHAAGTDITVQLAGRSKVAVGAALVVHAVAWTFGEGIAVRALSQEAPKPMHAQLAARAGDPTQHKANRDLQQRVADADLVVSGKVVTVNLPGGSELAGRTMRGPVPVSGKPVSEHDPRWREAVVSIDDVHKGEHGSRTVSVLFPASHDVRWFKAPKFEVGQQGYFMLQKQTMKPSERLEPAVHGRLAARVVPEHEPDEEVYTALHPLDYQPFSQQERIAGAIGTPKTQEG